MKTKRFTVQMPKDHPFLQLRSVKDYVQKAESHELKLVIVAEITEGRESVNFLLYTLSDMSLWFRISARGHLGDATLGKEFDEEKIMKSTKASEKYSV
jgi:hypothetical protein